MTVIDDIIGKVYNYFTVLEFSERKGNHKLYKCRCKCGTIKEVYLCNLKSGHSKSCGCLQKRIKQIPKGTKFGKWTVVDFAYSENGLAYWNCVCECETKRAVRGTMLRFGNTTNCGCVNIKNFIKRLTTHGMTGTREYRQWEHKRRRELEAKLDSTWTPDMELKLRTFQHHCVLCRLSEKQHQEKWGTSLHVDHVRPLHLGHGLKPGNAVLLCNECNAFKGRAPLKELSEQDKLKLVVNANLFKVLYEGQFI